VSYRGRYKLGDHVPLLLLTRSASGTPTLPLDVPYAKVWDNTGTLVHNFFMPIADRFAVTGLFTHNMRLGGRFPTLGMYRVVYFYNLSGSYHGTDEDTFELIAGGDNDGTVISDYFYNRPFASFVVQQLDSGKLVSGRNPRI